MKVGKVLDDLIGEVLSFRLYKKGKQPLGGLDPRDRIKKAIWTEDGVDLDLLKRSGPEMSKELIGSGIFSIKGMEVKEGIFECVPPHSRC